MRKSRRLLAALLCCLTLGGCVEQIEERPPSELIASDISVVYDAPQGDMTSARTLDAVLHYLSYDGTQLVSTVRSIYVSNNMTEEEAVLRALLADPMQEGMRAIAPGIEVQSGASAVEVSNGIVTVNLSSQARTLEPQELFTARVAIANTLTELSGVDYVNVLVEGREEGQDLGAQIPMGTLSRSAGGDVSALWNQLEGQRTQGNGSGLTKMATLYFPMPGARFMVPEVHSISFTSSATVDYAAELLREWGKGASAVQGSPSAFSPLDYLIGLPEESRLAGSSYTIVRLNFSPELEEALAVSAIPKGLFLAMMTYTLTGFIPMLDGVVVHIGDKLVDKLTEEESLDGREQRFEGGILMRQDFSAYLAEYCRLYFPTQSGDMLAGVNRPVPQKQSFIPRALFRQLLEGPQRADAKEGLAPALPEGISDADIIGLQIVDDVALINVSQAFADACADLSPQEERNVIYTIVNTMTELSQVRRVCFFVNGAQVASLAGSMEMRGYFVRNPGIILQED